MSTCKTCHHDKSTDELTPEGECFRCSTGQDESGNVSAAEIRDSFSSIAKSLGDKTNLTGVSVKKRLLAASKEKAD